MKKVYHYFLYRVYEFHVRVLKQKDDPILLVSMVSTLVICFNLMTMYAILRIYGLVGVFRNYLLVVAVMFLLLFMNYSLFIKDRKFLNRGFSRDVFGGVCVVLYFMLTVLAYLYVAQIHRGLVLGK